MAPRNGRRVANPEATRHVEAAMVYAVSRQPERERRVAGAEADYRCGTASDGAFAAGPGDQCRQRDDDQTLLEVRDAKPNPARSATSFERNTTIAVENTNTHAS